MFHTPAVKSPTEIHITVPSVIFEQEINPTVERILSLSPQLILGQSHLFSWDAANHCITLTSSFQELIQILVQMQELDPNILRAKSLKEFSAILQKPQHNPNSVKENLQPENYGLMRGLGRERWDLKDNESINAYRDHFVILLQRLGLWSQNVFSRPSSADLAPFVASYAAAYMTRLYQRVKINLELFLPTTGLFHIHIDHCIIFGGRVERMEGRILKTLEYLKDRLEVKGRIYLLGGGVFCEGGA